MVRVIVNLQYRRERQRARRRIANSSLSRLTASRTVRPIDNKLIIINYYQWHDPTTRAQQPTIVQRPESRELGKYRFHRKRVLRPAPHRRPFKRAPVMYVIFTLLGTVNYDVIKHCSFLRVPIACPDTDTK